jgi:hypothetical protein
VQTVEEALAALGRVEPELAQDARAAWQGLTAGAGPGTVTQWRLQLFCWDELARSWSGDGQRRYRVALALAELLDGLGMPRYAAIARGESTRQILLACEQVGDRGTSLARRAAQRSGIEPPSTELLTWGAVMGGAEARALELVADRLELAIAVGDLVPGSRGWRDLQSELTIAAMTVPHPDFDGTPYDAVLEERISAWVRGPRSTVRSSLLSPLGARLRDPIGPGLPAPARALLRPLAWLLAEVDDGVTLTAAGYLPPRTVARALDELGWREELIGPATREVDAYPVLVLRESATRLGLVRRRGPRLVLSPGGRAAVDDGSALWAAVAGGLIGPEHSALAAAWEIVLAVLEAGDPVAEEDVRGLVQSVVSESGWRATGRREPLDADTGPLFFAALRELRWLELVEESGALLDRRLRARAGAGDLFRAALRHRVLHRDVVP